MNTEKPQKGFTLIEIILVVTLLFLLATTAMAAIDPATRLADARNAQRFNDARSIMQAVQLYTADHEGALPDGITSTPTEICRSE